MFTKKKWTWPENLGVFKGIANKINKMSNIEFGGENLTWVAWDIL